MVSWGHMHHDPDDNYSPKKSNADGYYVGTNQNPDFKAEGAGDNNAESEPSKDRDGDDGAAEGEEEGKDAEKAPLPTERVSILQPLSYERRADNNFFGGRTTFYT